jgi:hypothetical protein
MFLCTGLYGISSKKVGIRRSLFVDYQPRVKKVLSGLPAEKQAGLPSLFGDEEIVQVRKDDDAPLPPIHH